MTYNQQIFVRHFDVAMQTKLTLRLDSELIAIAKEQARRNGKSLSEFVADYFAQFAPAPKASDLPPIVSSLIGVLPSAEGRPVDEQDYQHYLEQKYR